MKFLFFVLAAALCLQGSLSAERFRRDDAEVAKPSKLDELSSQATNFLGELGNQFKEIVSAKDTDELTNILKSNTDNFISKVTDITKGLQAQIQTDAGDSSSVLGKVVARLNQTIADLRQQDPDITKRADEIQAKLQAGLKTVVEETDKVAKTLNENTKDMQEDLSKLTKKAYDQVLETAKKIQEQIHEVANKGDAKKE